MKFDEYALDNAVRLKEGSSDLLLINRFKMWGKAYAPVLPAIQRAATILDYGCGAGEFLKFLAPLTRAKLVGFDVSPSQLELASALFEGLGKVVRFARSEEELTSLEEKKFDLVFCHHVVEHITDPDLPKFMEQLTQRVSQSGRLIISTPNGLNPFAYTYYMSTDKTHVRMHSVFSLAELLRPLGFEIESVHRELPQAYDISSLAKTIVWRMVSSITKYAVASAGAGMRGSKFPLSLAATFYVQAKRRHE